MSFDVAADAYDSFMGRWSALLSSSFADLAGVAPGQRALDVGCGTGRLTRELVERLGADAVAAVDPSEPFVEAMRERFPGVDVRQAPAERLPFDDDAFDAALAQLVVHFMSDPVAGIAEMARVTRPGGRVATSVWDYGGGRSPINPFWDAVATLGLPVSDEITRPGTRNGHLVELSTAAGLGDVRSAEIVVERAFATFDAWWEPFALGVGPAGAYLAKADAPTRTAIEAAARDRFGDGPFTLTCAAWVAIGIAPV